MEIKVHDSFESGNIDVVNPTRLMVVGLGGGGNNAINNMIYVGLQNVDYLAINTDVQSLSRSRSKKKLQIGRKTSQGLGVGGDPDRGREAAEENYEELRQMLRGTHMVFIATGMGGGTGTGGAPIIAKAAKEEGALVTAVVTSPFSFEGKRREKIARTGIAELKNAVDTIIVISNDKLIDELDADIEIIEAMRRADDALRQGVQGISDLITHPGYINIDFADVRAVMKDQGYALMGVGQASGERRAINAATEAINNRLLERNYMNSARGILINVAARNLRLNEFKEVVDLVTTQVDDDAVIKSGTSEIDDGVETDLITVTVIATGYDVYGDEAVFTSGQSARGSETESGDTIAQSEWMALQNGLTNSSTFTSPLNSRQITYENELEIPPSMRKRYVLGSKSKGEDNTKEG